MPHTITIKQGLNPQATTEHRPGLSVNSPLGNIVENTAAVLNHILKAHAIASAPTQPKPDYEFGPNLSSTILALVQDLMTGKAIRVVQGTGNTVPSEAALNVLETISKKPLELIKGVTDSLRDLGFDIDYGTDGKVLITLPTEVNMPKTSGSTGIQGPVDLKFPPVPQQEAEPEIQQVPSDQGVVPGGLLGNLAPIAVKDPPAHTEDTDPAAYQGPGEQLAPTVPVDPVD